MNRLSSSQLRPLGAPGLGAESTGHRVGPGHDALPPGARLAEYEILAVLGQGESAIVYLCMDHGLQRQVAIKEYLPTALASRGADAAVAPRSDGQAQSFARGLGAFIAEARLLARLDHPALMRVYRFWEANGTAYMVMPYYQGMTIGSARQSMAHPPTEAWLRELLLPLLDALDALHGAGCYPRDISPENILLLPDGRPVLLDCGAAPEVADDRTATHTVILKPAFAPIEQYAESATLQRGPWSSLYSLAAIAYYCVGGHAPVASALRALDDPMEPLSQVVDRLGRSFPALDYSVAFVSAIERALSVRPRERPQSVAEFRRALLGSRGAAESFGAPSAIDDPAPHGASPPRPSPRDDSGIFPTFPSASDQGRVDDAATDHQEPSPDAEPGEAPKPQPAREAENRSAAPPARAATGHVAEADEVAPHDAQKAAPRSERNSFDEAMPAGAGTAPGRRRRPWLTGTAAVMLVALGAGGWLMWQELRDASVAQPSVTLRVEPAERPATLPPPEPAARPPATAPADAAAESQTPPPELTASPAPEAPLPEEVVAVTDALTEETPPASPPEAKEPPRPEPVARVVAKEPDDPRVLCGSRTQFSLYRCMKAACDRSKYFDHPECKHLRVTDEVRALR